MIISSIIFCLDKPIKDPDTYYHAAAARAYAQDGGFNPKTSLPLTIFNSLPNDQHYGYHWLQSWFAKDLQSLKLLQTILVFVCLFTFFSIITKIDKKNKLYFLILLITSFGFMSRIGIIKSSALSVCLYLFFLYGLYSSSFLFSYFALFVFSLTHSGFIICLLTLQIYSFINYKNSLKATFFCLFFCGLGILIHPDNLNYLRFLKFQGIDIALNNQLYKDIFIGQEWDSPKIKTILISNFPILIAFIPLAICDLLKFSKLESKTKLLLVNCLALSYLYLGSSRFIEYLVPTILVYCATRINLNNKFKKYIVLPSTIFAVVLFPYAIEAQKRQSDINLPAQLIHYVIENVPGKAMICNLDWTDFPLLYYYLPNYKFLYGSDPRYLAFENPNLYQVLAKFIKEPNKADLDLIINNAKCDLVISNSKISDELFNSQTITLDNYRLLKINK